MQRTETISSHWSHTTWVGATIPLDHLATPVWVTLRRLQVLDQLRKLRNASPWQTASIIYELQPFRKSFEINDELKTKITRTICEVTNAHVDSSYRKPGTFGLYKGRPLRQLSINTDTVPGLVHLLSSDEPPVLRFASWALGKIAQQKAFEASVIAGSCRPFVALIQHEVIDVHLAALGALGTLACNSEVGRRAIVDAEALPEFVRLLSSSDPRVLEYSSMALANIASQVSLRASVIDVGSAQPLVQLLQHEVIDVHRQALGALANLACNSEVGRRAVVDAEALPEFVRLLSSSDPRVLECSSMALANIASQDSLTASVIDVGSAQPLVQLLQHEVIDVHRAALGALANLAWNSEVGRQAIVDAEALPEFVRLLSSSDPRVLERSSNVLANIASQDSLTASVIDVGSAQPLVQLLQHEVIDVHRQALGALANLAWNSEVGRQAIVDAEALPEFVRLLSSSDPRVLEYSSMALTNIASQDSLTASVIDVGSAQPLVQLLQHEVIDVHHQALCGVVNLAWNSEVGRRAIVDAEALPEFVRLLSSSDPRVLEYSSMALANIASQVSLKASVIDAGSVQPLVQLLRHEVINVHRQALGALANLAWNSEVGRQAIVDAEALPEFVRLLSSSDPRVLEYSSMALANIASQVSLKASVIDVDCVQSLVQLLQHEVIDVHRQALRALANLYHNSKVGRQAIVDTGAFSEFLSLVSSGYQVREYIDCVHNITSTIHC